MAKRDYSELDDWRYRYPSGAVSWNLIGDPAYCQQFVGEAKNMLYQLKNRMNIAVPKLKSLQDKRSPEPGTTIIVKSVFGQDFVEIDVSRVVTAIKGICTITFIDFPLFVPPMKNSGVIEPTDVVGIDYFKTYYLIDVSKCPTCQDIVWDFLFTYTAPVEPRHYDGEPNNHTVYSLSPPAWGQIIDHGHDDKGNYIIWKSYTETGILSRTGLGILLLGGIILDNNANVICSQQQKIDVDCCLKTPDLRKVEIWWEDFGTCQPYIVYEGMALCKMPTSVPLGGAGGLLVYRVFGKLYAIPEVNGGCLPFEWTASGALSLLGTSKDGLSTGLGVGIECTQPGIIKLKDRCGSTYTVIGTPCCDDADPLSILCTSLLMSCGGSQTLTAQGGCGPWSWAVTAGGGTIAFSPNDSGEAVYTAPATNVNCVDNPTITLTDCCGGSAAISLAVNCYTPPGMALQLWTTTFRFCCDVCPPQADCSYCGICHELGLRTQHWEWNCSGTVLLYYDSGEPVREDICLGVCGRWREVICADNTVGRNDCNGCCDGDISPWHMGTVTDERGDAMKAAGCCPLNPLTGLPF
jgi:hypothetical protein